jgi:uncharacterized protein YycO
MRKNVLLKKLSVLALVVVMLISAAVPTFAEDKADESNTDPQTLETTAEEMGVPVSDLEELVKQYPDMDLERFKESYIEAASFDDVLPETRDYGSGYYNGPSMTRAQSLYIRAAARKGDILVTPDSLSVVWAHGHAGIVTNEAGGVDNKKTVEALGSGELSRECDLSRWGSRYHVRLYEPSSSEGKKKKIAAANYAYNNLRNKPYDALASVNSQALNCSTLVYKAYRSQGVALKTVTLPVDTLRGLVLRTTVVPKTHTQDPALYCKNNVNWPV